MHALCDDYGGVAVGRDRLKDKREAGFMRVSAFSQSLKRALQSSSLSEALSVQSFEECN